ncbi:hypothetical protein [uncultured Nocardioides sp.]|uniref:hypothetical protein n=1 Tax=uncultured Nocardioides sp. TaxID=198441 RepID=UPI00261F158F|nr:hypothetical protein [uncultured Nocardioides sp.]
MKPLTWLRAVRDDPEATQGVLAVALALAATAKGTGPEAGTLYASTASLARWTGFSTAQVRRHMATLTGLGLIRQERRGGRRGGKAYATTWVLCCQPITDEHMGADPQPLTDEHMGAVPNCSSDGPNRSPMITQERGVPRENYRPPSPPSLTAVDGSAGGSARDDDEQHRERQMASLGDRLDREIGDVLDAAAAVTAIAEEAFGIDVRRIAPADLRALADRLAAVPAEHREGVVIEVIGGDPPDHVASPFGFIRHRLDRAAYRWPARDHPA